MLNSLLGEDLTVTLENEPHGEWVEPHLRNGVASERGKFFSGWEWMHIETLPQCLGMSAMGRVQPVR